jgi:hypothetical protein
VSIRMAVGLVVTPAEVYSIEQTPTPDAMDSPIRGRPGR